MIIEFDAHGNDKQLQAAAAWIDPNVFDIVYGGSKGSGKSFLGCSLVGGDALIYPETHYFVARKKLNDLRKFTLPSFFEAFEMLGVSEKYFRYNGQDNFIQFYNGSKIYFLEAKFLPSDPTFARFGSMQFTRGWIEEAGEFEEDAKNNLFAAVGRWKNDKYNLTRKLLQTCNPDANVLEKAVTWVIVLIVVVFDPLAVIMLLAAQMTFAWHRGKDLMAEEDHLLHETVPLYVADVGDKPTADEIAAYEKDDGPLTDDQLTQIKETADVTPSEQETALDQWNKMIEEAEAEAVKQADETAMQERIATGESYIDGEGKEVKLSPDFPQVDDIERPGDYLTPQEDISKKKTYMTKDEQGQTQVKSRS